MNNTKLFKILYYLCFLFNLFVTFISFRLITLYLSNPSVNVLLGIINFILVIIFTILLIKKRRLNNINILFPIIFLISSIIILFIAFLFNYKLIIPYIQINYYVSFILFNYTLLNIYAILSLEKK